MRVRVRVRVGVSTRVDDAHGHAVLDGVVEEDGVDGLAQRWSGSGSGVRA